jgi:hypothetical protein
MANAVLATSPPLCVIVWTYATVTVPLGRFAGDSVIVGHTLGLSMYAFRIDSTIEPV